MPQMNNTAITNIINPRDVHEGFAFESPSLNKPWHPTHAKL